MALLGDSGYRPRHALGWPSGSVGGELDPLGVEVLAGGAAVGGVVGGEAGDGLVLQSAVRADPASRVMMAATASGLTGGGGGGV